MIEFSLKKSDPKKPKDSFLINIQNHYGLETDLETMNYYENNTENYDINKKYMNAEEFLAIEHKNLYIGKEVFTESNIKVSELMNSETEVNQSSEILQETVVEESVKSIIFAILIYIFVSITIVFLNYKIFSEIIKLPIFVSWFQQLVGLAIFHLLKINKNQLSFGLDEFSNYNSFEWETGKYMIPLVLSFVGMVSLSNTCLKHVLVSTYQVARSTTIIFNLILSYIILKQKSSIMTIISCIIVMIGFIIGAFDSSTLNLNGVIYGVLSSILQSFYSVLIKKQLHLVNNNQIQLLYYQLYLSSVMFIPILVITGEIRYLYTLFNFNQGIMRNCFILTCLLISGILSILINFSTFQLIKKTNSITFNIIALLKSCIQSIGGVLLFNEILTFQSTFGILLTLFGTFTYSFSSTSNSSRKDNKYQDLENRS